MTAWPHGWYEPTEVDGAKLVQEFYKELGAAHVLKGASVRALATRYDGDDVLFALDDGRVAEVHLTYARAPERDPAFPGTALHDSLEKWLTYWINEVAPFY